MYLPSRPRRAWLRAFGATVGVSIMVVTSGIAFSSESLPWLTAGNCLGIVCAASAWVYPASWTLPYRVWNKAARLYTRVAHSFLLGLLYYGVFPYIRLIAPSLDGPHTSTATSHWMRRETLSTPTGLRQQVSSRLASHDHHWRQAYVSWVKASGHVWALALLPWLVLLALLEAPQEHPQPVNIYTLF